MMTIKGSELTETEVQTIRDLYKAWKDTDPNSALIEMEHVSQRLIDEHLVVQIRVPAKYVYAISTEGIAMVLGE